MSISSTFFASIFPKNVFWFDLILFINGYKYDYTHNTFLKSHVRWRNYERVWHWTNFRIKNACKKRWWNWQQASENSQPRWESPRRQKNVIDLTVSDTNFSLKQTSQLIEHRWEESSEIIDKLEWWERITGHAFVVSTCPEGNLIKET